MTKRKQEPYNNPDYAADSSHGHDHLIPPDNLRYPDSRIYGNYASKEPPRYVPHPYEHSFFKPRKEDYKPPMPCDGDPCSMSRCRCSGGTSGSFIRPTSFR